MRGGVEWAQFKNVEDVDLSNERIEKDFDGMQTFLKEHTTMTSLDVSNNNLGQLVGQKPVGVIALADGIKNNGAMTSLDISNNGMGRIDIFPDGWRSQDNDGRAPFVHTDGRIQYSPPEGAKSSGVIAISGAIPTMGALTSLNISKNAMVGTEAGKAFAAALADNTTLTELDLSGHPETCELDVAPNIDAAFAKEFTAGLGTNVALRVLNLSNNKLCTPEGGLVINGLLTKCTTLTWLDLSNNECQYHATSTAGFARIISPVLNKLEDLQTLYLGNNAFGSVGTSGIVMALRYHNCLKTLDLSNNKFANSDDTSAYDALIKVLPRMKSLNDEGLNVNDNGLTTTQVDEIRKAVEGDEAAEAEDYYFQGETNYAADQARKDAAKAEAEAKAKAEAEAKAKAEAEAKAKDISENDIIFKVQRRIDSLLFDVGDNKHRLGDLAFEIKRKIDKKEFTIDFLNSLDGFQSIKKFSTDKYISDDFNKWLNTNLPTNYF